MIVKVVIWIDRVIEVIRWLPNFLLLVIGIGAYSLAVSLGYVTAQEGIAKVALALVAMVALVQLDRRIAQRHRDSGKTSFGPPDVAVQLVAVLAAAGILTLLDVQVPLAFLLIMFTAAAVLQVKRYQKPGAPSAAAKHVQKKSKKKTK